MVILNPQWRCNLVHLQVFHTLIKLRCQHVWSGERFGAWASMCDGGSCRHSVGCVMVVHVVMLGVVKGLVGGNERVDVGTK